MTEDRRRGLTLISGGQTGVDRAALDVALAFGIPCGGACPRGRLSEDGRIPDRYPVVEIASSRYVDRTRANVVRADATLVLAWGEPTGGTAATIRFAVEADRPHRVCALDGPLDVVPAVAAWIQRGAFRVLNVAGPRASKHPMVRPRALSFLRALVVALGSAATEGADRT